MERKNTPEEGCNYLDEIFRDFMRESVLEYKSQE